MRLNNKKLVKDQDLKALLTKQYLNLFGKFLLVLFTSLLFLIMGYIHYNFYVQSMQIVEKYQNLLDEKIMTLDTSSLNFLYPTVYTKKIDNFLDPKTLDSLDIREVMDSLKTIAGPFFPYEQISIYNLQNQRISVGSENGLFKTDFTDNQYLQSFFEKDRDSSIFFNQEKQTVAYYRPYYVNFKKSGLLALEMRASNFFRDFSENSNIQMLILDNNGTEVFTTGEINHSKWIPYKKLKTINTKNWSIIYSINRSELFRTFFITLTLYLLGSLVFVIFLYRFTINLSSRVAKPIKNVSYLLINSNFRRPEEINTNHLKQIHNVKEIDDLNYSVIVMVEQLKSNLKEIDIAKQLEKKASISNTMTQTNPHFLYNILSNIISLAELDMTNEIIQLSENSSAILRYSTRDYDKTVSLQEELVILKNYSNMMKIRYGDRVNIRYDIPKTMYHIEIPKMVIHSILENVFKHGVSEDGNWNILITGEYYNDFAWEIQISDQGKGFSMEQIESFNNYNTLSFSEIYELFRHMEHTGMINAYLRTRYFFEGKATLFILSTEKGSTIVFNRWN